MLKTTGACPGHCLCEPPRPRPENSSVLMVGAQLTDGHCSVTWQGQNKLLQPSRPFSISYAVSLAAQFPDQGLNSCPPQWIHRALPTGPTGNSLVLIVYHLKHFSLFSGSPLDIFPLMAHSYLLHLAFYK